MFTLIDGRNELYQWDLNRQIAVNDPDVTEVHFCNRTDDCSLVVEVTNGVANIPNILLQDTWDIRVYAYCKEYTKVEDRFKVKARTKPADYVYTETEVLQYSTIAERMDNIENNISTVVAEEVNAYMEEHPVEVDLSNTAEKDHKHVMADITDYEEPDLSEYATKKDVEDAIDNIPEQEVDLDNYYTKEQVDDIAADKISKTSHTFAYNIPAQLGEDIKWLMVDVDGSISDSIVKRQGYHIRCSRAPEASYHVTNKEYVDNAISNALSGIATAEGGRY